MKDGSPAGDRDVIADRDEGVVGGRGTEDEGDGFARNQREKNVEGHITEEQEQCVFKQLLVAINRG